MMKAKKLGLLLVVVIAFSLLLPLSINVPVQAESSIAIGTKIVLDNGVVTTYLGKTVDGDYLWQAVFGGAKYLDDLQTPIDARWSYDSKTNEWVACANLFTARVKGGAVTVKYKGYKMDWQPQFEVKAITQSEGFATLLMTDPINDNYIGNTLQWNLGNGITRNLRIIEGMLIEYYTIDSLPGGDITIKANVNKDAGFVWSRPAVAWDSNNRLVDLKVVGDDITLTLDTMKEATFPITIDPDTTFTTSASDGHLELYDTDYLVAHDFISAFILSDTSYHIVIGQQYVSPHYRFWRGFVFFNTSVIPSGANITAATLKLYGEEDTSDTDFNITIRSGQPTYPHDPLIHNDYNISHYTSNDGGSINSSEFIIDGYNNITLNADGRGYIQTGDGANTKLALIGSSDYEADVPTDREYVVVYAYEQGVGYFPQLVVTYGATTIPSIATYNATYITRADARLNSYLSDDGGELCNVRFQYGNSTGNYTVNTTWVNYTYTTGDSPYVDIANLTNTTQYFFRVQATNTMGMINGSELNFTTYPTISKPTNFTAYPNSTSISLTWTKGVGATNTMIRGQVGAYPGNYTDGKQVYNGTMSTAIDTGLTLGTTYYYRAWSFDDVGYSTNYTDILMTTTAYTEVTQDVPATATTPSSWWGMPDYTKLSNIAGYGIINDIADNYEIPRNTFWMSLIIVAIMCIGLFIYSVQHNVTVALILTSIMIVVAAIAGLLPMFMLVIIGVPIGGIMIVKRRT